MDNSEFKPKKKLRRRLVGSRDTRYRRIWVGAGPSPGSGAVTIPVPGSTLWLRSDDAVLSAMSDGDPISTWFDQSGNGFDAIRLTDDTHRPSLQQGELNSKPGIQFSPTGDATHQGFVTPNFAAAYAAAEIFCLLKANLDVPIDPNLTGLWDYGDSGLAGAFPYTDTNYFEEWGTGTRATVGPIAADITLPTLVNVTTTVSEYTVRLNNSVVFTRAFNTVAFPAAGFIIGRSFHGFGYLEFVGHMFEIIVFPFALDAAMRAEMIAYFNSAIRWNTSF